MLITTCSSCNARFRVTPAQLNAKQGQVRCGRCRAVFNGFEALERFPDDDTGARLLAQREAEERVANETLAGIETLPDEDNLPEVEIVTAPPLPVRVTETPAPAPRPVPPSLRRAPPPEEQLGLE